MAATYGGMVGDKEQVGNARLIAAAPAMLGYLMTRAQEGDQQARAILDGMDPAAEER